MIYGGSHSDRMWRRPAEQVPRVPNRSLASPLAWLPASCRACSTCSTPDTNGDITFSPNRSTGGSPFHLALQLCPLRLGPGQLPFSVQQPLRSAAPCAGIAAHQDALGSLLCARQLRRQPAGNRNSSVLEGSVGWGGMGGRKAP